MKLKNRKVDLWLLLDKMLLLQRNHRMQRSLEVECNELKLRCQRVELGIRPWQMADREESER